MTEMIGAVLRTLNSVTVSGEDNLDKMLACIRALKQLEEQIGKEGEHGEDDDAL